MPDPFTPCPAMSEGHRCWLVRYHRGPHEIHPSYRLSSGGRLFSDEPCGRRNPHTDHGNCPGSASEFPSEPTEIVTDA
jgi:hypothetical protein